MEHSLEMQNRAACILAAFSLLFPALKSEAEQAAFSKDLFLSRVAVDVNRNKSSRIEGGDWDDKKDRISFKVKMRNGDPNRSFDGMKFELFVFGQSMVDKRAFRLLQKTTEAFSLAPLQDYIFDSTEIVSMWDNTGAIFGEKYKGWYLRIFGPDGKLVLEKSVVSVFDKTDAMDALVEGKYYDKNMKPLTLVGR